MHDWSCIWEYKMLKWEIMNVYQGFENEVKFVLQEWDNKGK